MPAYGAVASRVDRMRLVTGVTLFCGSQGVLFALADRAGMNVGIVYFVGGDPQSHGHRDSGAAADLYTPDQGKRLFPLIGVTISLGASMRSVQAGNIVDTMGPTTAVDQRRDPARNMRRSRAAGRARQPHHTVEAGSSSGGRATAWASRAESS